MSRWSVTQENRAVTARISGDGYNSLDEAALSGLEEVLRQVENDEDVRALVLTGAGSTFCIGLDLDLLGRAFADHDYFLDVVGRYHALLRRIETLPVPVIAAVNGTTRAGGFELLLACDLALVADDARVADHHMHFGILPGGGASARLPRRIGPQRARELLFTGRWLVGSEVVDYGLALRSVPGTQLLPTARELAGWLTDKPRASLARLKLLLDAQDGRSIADACQLELEHFHRFLDEEPLAADGYLAFVEKREPAWRAR